MFERIETGRGIARPAAAAGLLILVLAAAGAPTAATGQGSVRAWAMGGACTAASRGLDAVQWNPANLAIGGGTSLGLATAAVDLSNNSFSLDRYNEISGAVLTDADKDRILADIPDEGFRLTADVHASALGLRTGSFAVTFQALGGGDGRLDKDFFDLVLLGNEAGESVSFADTYGEAYAVGAATLSWATPLMTGYGSRLSAGVNLRYLRGIYEMHVEEAGGTLTTTMTEISGSAVASMVSATGGSGYGFDLGLALQAPRGWVLGLAMDNVASRVNWDGDPERRIYTVSADTINLTHEDLDSQVADHDTTYAVDPYRTALPRRLRLGASNRFGGLLVAADLKQGLENRGGATTRTEFGVGCELETLGWIRPRLGVCLGGACGRSVSAGFGLRLGPWRLDAAGVNRGEFVPGDTKGLALAVGTSLEF